MSSKQISYLRLALDLTVPISQQDIHKNVDSTDSK